MTDKLHNNTTSIKPPLAAVGIDQVVDGGAISLDIAFRAGRENVIVTRKGMELAAFINRCPHARWPLDTFDGRFLVTEDGDLMCAAHGAVFDLMTGACRGGPGTGRGLVPVVVIQVESGIEISE